VQAMNLCFLSGKSMQLVALTRNGGVAVTTWTATLPVVLAGVAALLAGIALRSRADTQTYRRWLEYGLFVIAIMLLGQLAWRAWNS